MEKRKQNHCVREREYTDTLGERVKKAGKMISTMSKEGRGPRMSIPAGGLVHADPCGDEDFYIVDLLDDLLRALAVNTESAETHQSAEGVNL